MVQPIKLYSAPGGPHPFKVVIILEEFAVPYEIEVLGYSKLKSKPYTDLNPNGRAPTIVDPNTGITVWESGAIYEYLIDTYDKEGLLTHSSAKEKWAEKQWLFFQVSGQGPYWGQAAWFNLYHSEQLPSAQDRYMDEIHRTVEVITTHLIARAQNSPAHPVLVGSKVTYADLIFVVWNEMLAQIFSKFPDRWDISMHPEYKRWIERLKERASVQKALQSQQDIIARMLKGEFQ